MKVRLPLCPVHRTGGESAYSGFNKDQPPSPIRPQLPSKSSQGRSIFIRDLIVAFKCLLSQEYPDLPTTRNFRIVSGPAGPFSKSHPIGTPAVFNSFFACAVAATWIGAHNGMHCESSPCSPVPLTAITPATDANSSLSSRRSFRHGRDARPNQRCSPE
jgi:hypothetical protein